MILIFAISDESDASVAQGSAGDGQFFFEQLFFIEACIISASGPVAPRASQAQ